MIWQVMVRRPNVLYRAVHFDAGRLSKRRIPRASNVAKRCGHEVQYVDGDASCCSSFLSHLTARPSPPLQPPRLPFSHFHMTTPSPARTTSRHFPTLVPRRPPAVGVEDPAAGSSMYFSIPSTLDSTASSSNSPPF
jgi:hypothetical protein